MTEAQLIDWICTYAQNQSKNKHLNDFDKKIFNSRIKRMQDIKAKLKRIDSFGGVESLITKASITGMSEKLFND